MCVRQKGKTKHAAGGSCQSYVLMQATEDGITLTCARAWGLYEAKSVHSKKKEWKTTAWVQMQCLQCDGKHVGVGHSDGFLMKQKDYWLRVGIRGKNVWKRLWTQQWQNQLLRNSKDLREVCSWMYWEISQHSGVFSLCKAWGAQTGCVWRVKGSSGVEIN